MHVTRLADATAFQPPLHEGVQPVWLQAPGGPVTTALSHYLPGGGASMAPVDLDTIYVVVDGTVVVTTREEEVALGRFDSVRLPAGTERSVENRTNLTASILVIRPAAG